MLIKQIVSVRGIAVGKSALLLLLDDIPALREYDVSSVRDSLVISEKRKWTSILHTPGHLLYQLYHMFHQRSGKHGLTFSLSFSK